MAYQPFHDGSVVAFQGDPTKLLTHASVSGNIAVTNRPSISGAIDISNVPQVSVHGNVGVTNTNLNVSGSVVAFQGGVRVTSLVSTVPSSVIFGASIFGLAPVNVTNTVNTNTAGSVVAFQGTNPWIVTGSVQAEVATGNSSVQVLNFPTTQNVSGSVVATQGTSPWVVNSQNSSILAVPVGSTIAVNQGSVAVAIISGSVAVATGNSSVQVLNFPANQSVSGTVNTLPLGTIVTSLVSTIPSSVIVGASIFGLAPVNVTNTNINVSGSVVAFPTGNQSVSGTIDIGSVTIGSVNQATIPWTISSVYGNVSGSVVAFQGAGWSGSVAATITNTNVNVSGSVVATQGTNPWVIGSIVGTYAEDAAHTTADKGLFVLGVRNDTLASVSSADLDYTPITVGPIGETVVANAPITKWVQGTASMLGGTPLTGGSVAIIAAQGASVFTYITGLQIVNAGATTQWLRFDGGTSSIIGYTIAPTGGGSNIVFPNALKTRQNAAFTASISGSGSGASVYLSAQGFIAKE